MQLSFLFNIRLAENIITELIFKSVDSYIQQLMLTRTLKHRQKWGNYNPTFVAEIGFLKGLHVLQWLDTVMYIVQSWCNENLLICIDFVPFKKFSSHFLDSFHYFWEKETHSSFYSCSCIGQRSPKFEFLRGDHGGCCRVSTFEISRWIWSKMRTFFSIYTWVRFWNDRFLLLMKMYVFI